MSQKRSKENKPKAHERSLKGVAKPQIEDSSSSDDVPLSYEDHLVRHDVNELKDTIHHKADPSVTGALRILAKASDAKAKADTEAAAEDKAAAKKAEDKAAAKKAETEKKLSAKLSEEEKKLAEEKAAGI